MEIHENILNDAGNSNNMCLYCSKTIPEGALFCPWCGKSAQNKEKKPAHAQKKRGNGQGTVYKDKNGKYIASRTLGYFTDDNGKKHRKTIRKTYDKKKDAVAALPTLGISHKDKQKAETTLKRLYDLWIPTHEASKSTIDCYTSAFKYFEPLHNLYVSDIDIDDLQECMDDCPRGKRTQQNMKACIGLIYKYGIPRGYFPDKLNLAQYLKVGGESGNGGVGIPDEYLSKIIDAAGHIPGADLIYAQCYLGFRPSEFLALTHDSYDADRKLFVGGAKTEAGKNRTVTVSPKIQKIVDKYAAIKGPQFFCGENGKLSVSEYRDLFYKVFEELGLDNPIIKFGDKERHTYTPHSCRHTFANLMKRAKGSDKDKQALIGHSSSEMLRYYQDAPVDDIRKITDQI